MRFMTLFGSLLIGACASTSPAKREGAAAHVGAEAGTQGRTVRIADRFWSGYDRRHAGFNPRIKRIEPYSLELAWTAGSRGDARAAVMAQRTLLTSRRLIDADGGMWDLSLAEPRKNPWRSPVRVKSAETQADALRAFSIAAATWDSTKYPEAAGAIDRFIEAELTAPDGSVYAGKICDPACGIDRSVSARANARMIAALVSYYGLTGRASVLERALRAGAWLAARWEQRALDVSIENDAEAFATAMLALHRVTGEGSWLRAAESAAELIGQRFDAADSERAVEAIRLAIDLWQETGHPGYLAAAVRRFERLALERIGDEPEIAAAVLLAEVELRAAVGGGSHREEEPKQVAAR